MKNKNSSKLAESKETMEDENQEQPKKEYNYGDILNNNSNIFISIKNNKSHIKLLNSISYLKINTLNKTIPEKNIKFKYSSDISDTDSDNSSKNSLKGIDKLKERLCEDSHENNIKYKKHKYKSKKLTYDNIHVEKEDKNSVILLDEVKSSVQSILNKEENSIVTNFELYKMTWKNLYKWLLLFPLTILFGLLYFNLKLFYPIFNSFLCKNFILCYYILFIKIHMVFLLLKLFVI